MAKRKSVGTRPTTKQRGFSLIELMLALAILVSVSGVVLSGIIQMSYTQGMITNRTQMHASVRNATELLQQEIGQAGRATLPSANSYSLAAAVSSANAGLSSTVALSTVSKIYVGEQLVVDAGTNQETVTVTAVNTGGNTITAVFNNISGHASGVPVTLLGTFTSGVVPTAAGGYANGSTGSLLKLFGDINGDTNMVYIEYKCDTAAKKLYRNVMAYDAASKPALTDSKVLLNNILANPDASNCFTYQEKVVGADTYVVNVAVTLTVQTELPDPKTHQYQQETKALLNVSPRNVFEGWELASAGITTRNQIIPPAVTALLP
jgi:prepilin-type N-terminal cleavage/methylation domain-containing protein